MFYFTHNHCWWLPVKQNTEIISQVTWLVVTEVRSKSFGLVTEHHHKMWRQSYFGHWSAPSTTDILFFSVECGIVQFLCAMCVFEVRASSSSPRIPFAKFRFFRGPHCSASRWTKITDSFTHSLTELIWCPGNWKLFQADANEGQNNFISRVTTASHAHSAYNTLNCLWISSNWQLIFQVVYMCHLRTQIDVFTSIMSVILKQ